MFNHVETIAPIGTVDRGRA